MIDAVVELSNIEIHEHCMLNRITGEREYNNGKKQTTVFELKIYLKQRKIHIWQTKVRLLNIASWFDEPGGGIQYWLPDTVNDGILRRIQ